MNEVITENEQWRVFRTPMSDRLQKDFDGYDASGIRLGDRYRVYRGLEKDTDTEYYMVFDRSGKVVQMASDLYMFDAVKVVLAEKIREENDIVNMAKAVGCGNRE